MIGSRIPRAGWLNLWPRIMFIVVVGFVLGLITYYATEVRRSMYKLATASNDSVQWNLAQLEVEYHTLRSAVAEGAAGVEADISLDDIRKRFDVFYSRLQTLIDSDLYSVYEDDRGTSQRILFLYNQVSEMTAIIDAPDEEMQRQLPVLYNDLILMRQDIRRIALFGIRAFSDFSQEQRARLNATLQNVALFAAILVALLAISIWLLLLLNRANIRKTKEVQHAKTQLEGIISSSLDAIIVTDDWGYVVEYNGAAECIFGYKREEALAQAVGKLIVPERMRDAHFAGIEAMHKSNSRPFKMIGSGRTRQKALHKDGHSFPVEISVESLDVYGEKRLVSFLRDISKEVDQENQILEARDSAIAGEKSKARLLAVMSHEMRTPLNGMLGTMELLEDTDLNAKQSHYLAVMRQSGELLLSHVNDVLDVSRHDAGRIEIARSAFDLDQMLHDLIEELGSPAMRAGNRLRYLSGESPIKMVCGDRMRLKQVLVNLVGNAIKFTRDGCIDLEADAISESHVEIRVKDTGVGIEQHALTHIFDDFVTGDSSYGREEQGTGLGLGIAQRYVQAMDGEIGVESEPGKGSTFWVRLPLLSDGTLFASEELRIVSEQRAGNAPRRAGQRTLDVLLVEDNEVNRLVARDMLQAEGHSVDEAENGSDGVRAAEARRYDLILMDISMPRLDGCEATRRIRSGKGPSARTPIIALTAHAMPDDLEYFQGCGMDDVIVKPVSRSVLRRSLADLSAGRKRTHVVTQNPPGIGIDFNILSVFREDIGEEKFFVHLKKFITETDDTISDLHDKTSLWDISPEMASDAHRIAGSAALFGAHSLREALLAYERSARAADRQRIYIDMARIERAWQRMRGFYAELK